MAENTLTTGRIAEIVGGQCEGDPNLPIEAVAPLATAGVKDVTFAADDKRVLALANSTAGAAIVASSAAVPQTGVTLIRAANVQVALAALLEHLSVPEDLPATGVHASAIVAGDAEVADGARIGPCVVIGSKARIGERSALLANVSIGSDVEIGSDVVLCEGVSVRHGCKIGNNVRIGPNSVIGYDGFGYYFAEGKHNKIAHIGNVVIEDDVEIGACSCVDRAKFGSTRIGAGTKIDNLVQVAHNVRIGQGCVAASLSGIAGSSVLGDYVVLGGHVGIRDNVNIGTGATCAAYTAVAEDVPDGQTMFGIPAVGVRQKFREISLTRKLPELSKRVAEIEKRLEHLDASANH